MEKRPQFPSPRPFLDRLDRTWTCCCCPLFSVQSGKSGFPLFKTDDEAAVSHSLCVAALSQVASLTSVIYDAVEGRSERKMQHHHHHHQKQQEQQNRARQWLCFPSAAWPFSLFPISQGRLRRDLHALKALLLKTMDARACVRRRGTFVDDKRRSGGGERWEEEAV